MSAASDIADWCLEELGLPGASDMAARLGPDATSSAEAMAAMFAASPHAHVHSVVRPVLLAIGDSDRSVGCCPKSVLQCWLSKCNVRSVKRFNSGTGGCRHSKRGSSTRRCGSKGWPRGCWSTRCRHTRSRRRQWTAIITSTRLDGSLTMIRRWSIADCEPKRCASVVCPAGVSAFLGNGGVSAFLVRVCESSG